MKSKSIDFLLEISFPSLSQDNQRIILNKGLNQYILSNNIILNNKEMNKPIFTRYFNSFSWVYYSNSKKNYFVYNV